MIPRFKFPFALATSTIFSVSLSSAAITLGGGVGATVDEVSSTNSLLYSGDVSSIDQLQGNVPIDNGNWFTTSGRTTANFTDGVHGGLNDVGTLAQSQSPPAVAVFDLGVGANGLGYNLTQIVSIASWRDSGFGNQNWVLDVAGVGDDGSLGSTDFTTLASATFQPIVGGGGTKITLDNLSGTLTTGVQYIRFTALASSGSSGRTAWRELDIFAEDVVPIPEPSSLAFVGLSSLAFLLRRRR